MMGAFHDNAYKCKVYIKLAYKKKELPLILPDNCGGSFDFTQKAGPQAHYTYTHNMLILFLRAAIWVALGLYADMSHSKV